MANFALITIGDELIKGELSNKNSILVAKILNTKGHNLEKIITIGDNKKRIISSLKKVCKQFNYIIVTGGLGPTQDDKTREAIAEASNKELVFFEDVADKISSYFRNRSLKMTENNFRQAYFPEGVQILKNPRGTAPGFKLNWENSLIYVLPGVTEEMTEILKQELDNTCNMNENNNDYILKIAGIGEAELEDKLLKIIENSQHKYRFLPRRGEIEIRIKRNKKDDKISSTTLKSELKKIKEILGNNIFSQKEDKGLPEAVKETAINHDTSLSLAESCTGGLIGKRLTDVPGASNFFAGGIIAYNNDIKKKLLNVRPDTLKSQGAVSKETAKEMAIGVNQLTKTTISASVTGIAGPGGGTRNKPVGLVYFALYHNDKVFVEKWNLNGGRSKIRWFTSQHVLNYIRIYLLEELSKE